LYAYHNSGKNSGCNCKPSEKHGNKTLLEHAALLAEGALLILDEHKNGLGFYLFINHQLSNSLLPNYPTT